jgi:hypothetical protein
MKWQPQLKEVIGEWWQQIRSPAAIWMILPAVGGLAFVYLADMAGWRALISKPLHEVLAINLLGLAAAFFLVRAWLFRLKLDYLLLVMAINFLSREIHFRGTDNGVVLVTAGVLVLSLFWGAQILATLRKAPRVRLAMTGTFLTYLLGQLIQRRVFTSGRIPLLPDEALLHVPLEEVTENVAHLYFIIIGIAAFKDLPPGGEEKQSGQ